MPILRPPNVGWEMRCYTYFGLTKLDALCLAQKVTVNHV